MSAHLASADLRTGWPKQQISLSAIFEIIQNETNRLSILKNWARSLFIYYQPVFVDIR